MPFFRGHVLQDAWVLHDYVVEADNPEEAAEAGIDQWKGRRDDIVLEAGEVQGFDHAEQCDPEEIEEITEEEYREALEPVEKPADPLKEAIIKACDRLERISLQEPAVLGVLNDLRDAILAHSLAPV